MKPDLHEIHKQHTFDSFCKKVLKHEAGNGHREINRRARMEISMSDLPEEAMEQLAVYDDYPWDYTPFQVGDETVLVKDDRLAEALAAIPEKERNIILLYWFLELADREIADRMGIARRTVNTHRQNAYRLLKKLMGGDADSNATHTRMIPYPVIEAAVRGDTDAVNEVIRHYSGYIAALCKRTGRDENGNYCTYVDEELRRRLETKLIISILGFDLN